MIISKSALVISPGLFVALASLPVIASSAFAEDAAIAPRGKALACPQLVSYSINKQQYAGCNVYTHNSLRLEAASIFFIENGAVEDPPMIDPDCVQKKVRGDSKTNGDLETSVWHLKHRSNGTLSLVCDYAG